MIVADGLGSGNIISISFWKMGLILRWSFRGVSFLSYL